MALANCEKKLSEALHLNGQTFDAQVTTHLSRSLCLSCK